MLKLFISYSHANEDKVINFITYMAPLTDGENPLLNIWYDRNIKAGDDFWDEIDKHLADRDIVCLFLSRNYLASRSCKEEMKRSILMYKTKGTLVIPVILSTCRWLDADQDLKKLLAATTDAKPINSYGNEDEGWDDVYGHIKDAALKYSAVKDLAISENFMEFLNDATLLKKAHPEKNELTLDDIYVNQELSYIDYTGSTGKKENVENLINTFEQGSKYIISGDDQSGKTSILKKTFVSLKKRFYIPIYIADPQKFLLGRLVNRVEDQFHKQYNSITKLEEYDPKRIVILIDDFHNAKNKEKLLEELQQYQSCILMVDDIFSLDVTNEQLVVDFDRYRIRELKASLRNKLIKNWLSIREDNTMRKFPNEELARIDELTEFVEQSLGKAIGNGIMPAHPFFILYVLSTYDFEFRSGDNPNITSQGHCYQALIYFFLRSQGVGNEYVDGYLNFFTEFAKAIFMNKGNALEPEEFDAFLREYDQKFNFVEDKRDFLRKVRNSSIISVSSLGSYSFGYPYLYYYFAGKYFSEQWDDKDSPEHEQAHKEVKTIMLNLQKTSNAYIAIFIAHHTKSAALLKLIMEIADGIFKSFQPASLDAASLYFFGEQGLIPSPKLPANDKVEVNRQRALEIQDQIEENKSSDEEYDEENEADEFSTELRRSIKTVEVIGSIIKNRAGSLSIEKLKEMFQTGMDVHLRHISLFLEIVKKIIQVPNYSDFLINRIEDKFKDKTPEQLKTIALKLFWTLNNGFIFGVIRKISKSLGSAKLIKIVTDVCDKRNTPVSYMIKHTIYMWNKKNIRVDELKKMDMVLNSPITKNIMLWLITDYCSMHRISYRDVSKLEKLGIKRIKLLHGRDKGK